MGRKREKPFDHARAIKACDGSKGSLARKRASLLAGTKDNAPTLRRQAFQGVFGKSWDKLCASWLIATPTRKQPDIPSNLLLERLLAATIPRKWRCGDGDVRYNERRLFKA
jgi:hypothetical protein